MGKLCLEQTDLSCAPVAHPVPLDLDLVELARWASLFVSTALAAHHKPRELAAQRQLLEVAAVLRRMLGPLRLPRRKGRMGKA